MSDVKSLKWWRSPRSLLRRILMSDDSSHSIALGTAIGVFFGMTPTVGLQLILVIITAALTRKTFYFNRPAALITVYISNPLTVVPIYYFLFLTGTLLIPGQVTRQELAAVLQYDGFGGWWESVTELFVRIGGPLLVGTAIVAPISGIASYPVVLWVVKRCRRTKPAVEIRNLA